MKRVLVAVAAIVIAASLRAADTTPPQQFATIGDFGLDNGQVIRNCRIGYRLAGTLAADKSNVLVLTTWFGGTSEGLLGWVGEGKLFDTSKFHIIIIDALGDGVSSSPSNSPEQPGETFPQFTMREMVRSQHELLTRELKLDRVYAVAGLSMGGMQTFQWIASYPDFMQKAVAIVGSPKLTSYDILLWQTELDTIQMMHGSREAMRIMAGMNDLELYTPEWIANNVHDVKKAMDDHTKALTKLDPFDYMSDLRAMISQDIGPDFHPPLKPQMLIVVSLQDHMVNPAPAREFARVNETELVTLSGNCGHIATSCEREVLTREVHRFLGGSLQ